MTIVDAEELGGAMTEKLAELFDDPAGGAAAPASQARRVNDGHTPSPGVSGSGGQKPRGDTAAPLGRALTRPPPSQRQAHRAGPILRSQSRFSLWSSRRSRSLAPSIWNRSSSAAGSALRSAHRVSAGFQRSAWRRTGGNFIAVSDGPVAARSHRLPRGRPTGIADAEMAPILGADGQTADQPAAGTMPRRSLRMVARS